MTSLTDYAGWSEDYALGIQEIDEQHHIVFEQIESLRMAIVRGDSRRVVGNIIDNMIEYTRVHLIMEECVMRLFAYADYMAHKSLHDAAVERIDEFARRHHAGEAHVALEFYEFLGQWWRSHILETDADYVSTLTWGRVARTWLPGFKGLLRWRQKSIAASDPLGR